MIDFFAYIALAALGGILGSFAAVVSERLHTGESWANDRSRCNSCTRTLDAIDLVPILSWAAFRGACRTCRAAIPYRYTITELTLAVVFVASYLMCGLSPALPFLLISFFFLTIIVLYDLRHTIVPLNLALLFIFSSLAFAIIRAHHIQELGMFLIVAAAIGLLFFIMHIASRGRAMGLGDAPIALGLSLLVGSNAISGLLFSFWIGAVIGIGILVTTPKGHRMGIEIPFVPFLAGGYLLALFTQWHILPF